MKPGNDKIGSEYFYTLGDMPTSAEYTALGVVVRSMGGYDQRNVRAIWTGEKRPPKAGEWFLSGAIISAYKAPNDMPAAYHIARLVVIKETTTYTVSE